MTSRRFIAALTLVAGPFLLAGCSGAEVQSFFTDLGRPIPQGTADRIAAVLTKLEKAHEKHRGHKCDTPTTTAAPSTTVPDTVVPSTIVAPTVAVQGIRTCNPGSVKKK